MAQRTVKKGLVFSLLEALFTKTYLNTVAHVPWAANVLTAHWKEALSHPIGPLDFDSPSTF